jgi:hypothetical protein
VVGFFKPTNGDAAEEEPHTLLRYISNDPTPAALGQLHTENQNALLVYRDEVVSLLQSFEREDNAERRGFYLTGWNGTSGYTFDRITRGMNLHIPAVCISMLGSTQPSRIARYLFSAVRGGSGDDWVIQRFGLMVWRDVSGEWQDVDRPLRADAKRAAIELFKDLDSMDPLAIGSKQDVGFDTGIGDSGSCSSCSLHDAIVGERLGIPALAVMTEPFVSAAELMCRVARTPGYKFAVIGHPISSASDERLAEYARATIEQASPLRLKV